SPNSGNGPYIIANIYPPGVEAGFRYNVDRITLGELIFLNLDLNVSMLLPFDDRGAEFKFTFASRDKPFMILALPYFGGGFFALTATAKGIASFEISLEFGAAVDFTFGPLGGQG